MTLLEAALILLAGLGAGTINAIVGSGTLITFPALVAFGVPPVTATMSNAVGLIPGNIASSLGYREEIRGQGARLLRLVPASVAGALLGAFLLLTLPEDAFETIVPVLIVLALLLVIGQPALQRMLARRRLVREPSPMAAGSGDAERGSEVPGAAEHGAQLPGDTGLSRIRRTAVVIAVFATAVYGGYFAAAQGIILIALLGMLLPDSLQRLNGAKNILVLAVNTVAATVYIIIGFDRIDWTAVLLIAVGSLLGGYAGARVGRRLHPVALRAIIVALGLIALWNLLRM